MKRDLNRDVAVLLINIENVLMGECLVLIVKADERAQTSFEEEGHRRHLKAELAHVEDSLRIHHTCFAGVHNANARSLYQICLLAQMRHDFVVVEINAVLENSDVRLEEHDGTLLGGLSDGFHLGKRFSDLILLHVHTSVFVHEHLHVLRKRVHHRSAHAVETAGNFVTGILSAELASGVKRGHDGLECRDFRLGMDAYRNTAAVINNAYVSARQKRNFNVVRESAHGLVARVIENLPDEVMESIGTGGTDVHARTLSDGFKALKHRNA